MEEEAEIRPHSHHSGVKSTTGAKSRFHASIGGAKRGEKEAEPDGEENLNLTRPMQLHLIQTVQTARGVSSSRVWTPRSALSTKPGSCRREYSANPEQGKYSPRLWRPVVEEPTDCDSNGRLNANYLLYLGALS